MKKCFIIIQFLLALFFVACSSRTLVPIQSTDHLDGVEIKTEDKKELAQPPQIGTDARAEISTESAISVKAEVKTGINLLVGPGGYHSFGLVGFFKSLEKKQIKIKQLYGIEMGGLVAALYSKYRKSSVVEWELFKLLNKIDEEESLFSPHWNKVLGEFIKKNFGNVDFSDLGISLKLAALTNHGEVEWFDSGSVEIALLESLKIQPEVYKKFLWPNRVEGEDIVSLDILSSNLVFKQKISENFYNGFLSFVKEMKKNTTQNINLKFTQGYVDSYKNWQNNVPIAQGYGAQLAKSLQNKSAKSE